MFLECPAGELNPKAKLTADDVRAIRRSADTQSVLARRYGVRPDTIWSIRTRKTWRHIDDANDAPEAPSELHEQWKPIPGFDCEVSNLGRVRTARGPYLPKQIRATKLTEFGYVEVILSVRNRQRHVFVHRLVMLAFVGPVPEGHEVNHKSGDKTDNRLENLEYVTGRQNIRHAERHCLRCHPDGERSARAKLTTEAVRAIRASVEPYGVLAARFGVTKSAVYLVKSRQCWRHV